LKFISFKLSEHPWLRAMKHVLIIFVVFWNTCTTDYDKSCWRPL